MGLRLAIDPGHGYSNRTPGVYDPGAVAAGVAEADVALQWALTGKWVLGQMGLEVWLTRDDDRDPAPVGTRDDRALRAGCSHFISLHCNSSVNAGATGTETYYRDKADAGLALAVQRCALEAMWGDRKQPLLYDRGLKLEGQSQHPRLAVLDFPGPACLLEVGFISNLDDRTRMLSRERRVRFWQLLAGELGRLQP